MQVESYEEQRVFENTLTTQKSLDFSVKNPAIIFDILTNRMYQNPLRTMTQEYMSNARDAHREVGKENVPIEVTVPTKLDPHLRIRDFGPGLSPQRIEEVFVFLGESTKRADNLQTGGFGVGAKVGWAYTDSFTVWSYHQGTLRSYLAFMGDGSVGKLNLLKEEPTTEPDGVEVQIRIKEDDFYDAKEAVKRISYFWKVTPDLNFDFEAYTGSRDPFSAIDGNFSENTIVAVVDGIPYEADKDSIPSISKLKFNSWRETFAVFFETGEVEVAVNREGLRYSEQTLKAFEKYADVVTAAETARYASADDALTLADKLKILNKKPEGMYMESTRVQDLGHGLVLKAQQNGNVALAYIVPAPVNSDYDMADFSMSIQKFEEKLASKVKTESIRAPWMSVKNDLTKCRRRYSINNVDTWWVYNGKYPPKDKILKMMEDTGMMIHNKRPVLQSVRVLVVKRPEVHKTLVDLGLNDLNAIKVTAATASIAGQARYIGTRTSLPIANLTPGKHFYIPFSDQSNYTDTISWLVYKGIVKDRRVMVVAKHLVESIQEQGIEHVDVMIAQLKKGVQAKAYAQWQRSSTRSHWEYDFEEGSDLLRQCKALAKLEGVSDPDFMELVMIGKQYDNYETGADIFGRHRDIARYLGVGKKSRAEKFIRRKARELRREGDKLSKVIKKRYPLLRHLTGYSVKDKELVEYVELLYTCK